MGIRSYIPNKIMGTGRWLGQALGCELVVELSDHSIQTEMEVPDRSKRAWDPHHYKTGNVFYLGYANPIKPTVKSHKDLEQKDTVDVEHGPMRPLHARDDVEQEDVGGRDQEESSDEGALFTDGGEKAHVEIISSKRYRDFMRQNLMSELLTPREQWKLIAIAVAAVAVLQLITLMVSLSAAGVL